MTKSEAIIEKAVASAMGKEVIIREIRGKIVVSDKPEFKKRILSEKQELVTEFMEDANAFVKAIMNNEELRNAAQIRLNVTSQRLYTTMISEYWKKYWGTDGKKRKEDEEELVKFLQEQTQKKQHETDLKKQDNPILPESQNP